jgi:5-methylcytosine-specific restriction protein B
MIQADKIRQFVLDTYIESARAADKEYVMVRAGDVSKAMGLLPPGRLPNVCQVLRGAKFKKLANVELLGTTGPRESTTTTFRYRIL